MVHRIQQEVSSVKRFLCGYALGDSHGCPTHTQALEGVRDIEGLDPVRPSLWGAEADFFVEFGLVGVERDVPKWEESGVCWTSRLVEKCLACI